MTKSGKGHASRRHGKPAGTADPSDLACPSCLYTTPTTVPRAPFIRPSGTTFTCQIWFCVSMTGEASERCTVSFSWRKPSDGLVSALLSLWYAFARNTTFMTSMSAEHRRRSGSAGSGTVLARSCCPLSRPQIWFSATKRRASFRKSSWPGQSACKRWTPSSCSLYKSHNPEAPMLRL